MKTRIIAFIALLVACAFAQAKNVDLSTVPKRNTVQLTIYNSEDLTLVRETRAITFKKGANPLQFSWANTLIDPTSVELKFLTNDTNALIEWLRLPGDIVFIAGGAIPTLYIAYLGIRYTVERVTLEEPDDILFTDLAHPEGLPAADEDEAAAARLT